MTAANSDSEAVETDAREAFHVIGSGVPGGGSTILDALDEKLERAGNETREQGGQVSERAPEVKGFNLRPVTQTILHEPVLSQQGIYGNCLQAAIASYLGLPLDAVPHFVLFTWYKPALELWARGRSMTVKEESRDTIPDWPCIIGGMSTRGIEHVCINRRMEGSCRGGHRESRFGGDAHQRGNDRRVLSDRRPRG